MDFIGDFAGIRFIENPNLTERVQCRFPRSGKKRIQKKWARNEDNFTNIPSDKVYILKNDTVIGHPQTIAIIKLENLKQDELNFKKWR